MRLFREQGVKFHLVGSPSFVYDRKLDDYVPATGESGEGTVFEGHQHYKYLVSDVN